MTPGRRRSDPARRAAYDAVHAVTARDAYANLVLPHVLRQARLTGRDAAFATELTYGTLRGLGVYDAVVGACLDRPIERLDADLLDVLRLGAHQLLASRVPDHAAVSATVDLGHDVVGVRRSGLVNAVLRRVATDDRDGWMDRLAPSSDSDPLGHLAFVHSHPRWVAERFYDALDGDLAETESALRADNEPAKVTLVARPGRSTRDELVAAGATPTRWSPYAATLAAGSPQDVAAVHEGRAGVQDEGSQLVAEALVDAPVDGVECRWLDLCAGPGGKAALLAAIAAGRNVHVLAAERQVHRAGLVAQALGFWLGSHALVVAADGRAPAWRPGAFDRVLADVPCTGLGALRRRPEARWRRSPTDVEELVPLQRELLGAALAATRPGGVVAYVTCSPVLAETSGVVDTVLADRTDVERLDARSVLPAMPGLGPGPDVQMWPHRHGTDAMFLALLRRNR